MWLLHFLIIWLTPILLFFPLVYIDMSKGESVKEYFEKYDSDDSFFFLLVMPGVGILCIFIFILLIFYNKLKNFRK